MKSVSEYIKEAVARRTSGKYRPRLVFPEGTVKDEYKAALDSLKEIGANQFSVSDGSFINLIDLRVKSIEKYRSQGRDITDRVEYCLFPAFSHKYIMVIGKGNLEPGRKACVLSYKNEDGGMKLYATYFFEYNGTKWIQKSGPNRDGWGNPREHEYEINSILEE